MTTNFDLLKDSVTQYIVRPTNAFGLGGFVFDIEGETTINLNTEITDHFLEDNSTIQDHIAIKPKKVVLRSYVGELVDRQDDESNTIVQQVVRKLTTLTNILPPLSSGESQEKQNETSDLVDLTNLKESVTSQTINKVTDYWSFVKNLAGLNSRQEQAYQYFKALMEQKILVSLQTPFEYINNMAIESIIAIQGENSRFVSDFSITLKQIRTAEILNVPKGAVQYQTNFEDFDKKFQGRLGLQNEKKEQLGQVSGEPPLLENITQDKVLEFLNATN